MPWSDLAGQERAVSTLRRAIAEDRLHHVAGVRGENLAWPGAPVEQA